MPLLSFFAAAFLIAWGAWIPLFSDPSMPKQIAFLGLFAPAIAAFSTAGVSGGTAGIRDIIRRLTILRFPVRWGLFAALVMPAIYAVAIGTLRVFRPGQTRPLLAANSPLFIIAGFIWLLFVTSGEELGWRGYALPRLLEHSDHPILVSLGLGLIWGAWHLPLYLLPGQSAFPLGDFLVFTSLQSVLYTLIFLRTRGSLLPALLLHAGTDIAPRVFQLAQLPPTFWVIVDVTLAVVVIALLFAMRRRLSSAHDWPTGT